MKTSGGKQLIVHGAGATAGWLAGWLWCDCAHVRPLVNKAAVKLSSVMAVRLGVCVTFSLVGKFLNLDQM